MFRQLVRAGRVVWAAGLMSCMLMLAASAAWGQGLLVNVQPDQQMRLPRPIIVVPPPVPTASYKIKELDVQVRLQEQVARVQVSQSFVNTGSIVMEVCFVFPLPYDGAIDQLTLLIDGKEYPAKLLGKEEARRLYEEIVRKNRDPALLEWMGTGLFQTSVFPVPPGAERKVSLRYTQLCRKDRGLTDFLFPLATARYTSEPLERLNLRLTIESQAEIKNVYSPTHTVDVVRAARTATVTYKAERVIPSGDFRLFYDVGEGPVGTSVMSYKPANDEGYFLILASPEVRAAMAEPAGKTVLFVFDRSGSMSGEKIEQARGALKFVLNNLREGDLFNIITYDSGVESFRPELQRYTDETRSQALAFVEGIYAGGSTNIDGALVTALAQLKDSSRPNYVLFLTDGLPTAGETNEMRIVANSKAQNQVRARMIVFGVGYDVNSRLLDRLARAHFGQSEYVRPNENIEERVASLYRKIEAPVLTDVQVEITLDGGAGAAVNRVYPRGAFDLFAGEQLVVVGRYRQAGAARVVIRGMMQGQPQAFDFPAEFASESKDETFAFVEKLWAIRRIGEIIDELDLNGPNEELVKELVGLSTRHGILTPYTSFLADESAPLSVAANLPRAAREVDQLKLAEGQGGFSQRRAKAELLRGQNLAAAPAGPGGQAVYRDAASDRDVVVDTVRNIGNKAFYRKNSQWVDATVTEEMQRNAKRVAQFSDEYFDLAARHGKRLSQYLVFDEPVLINLDGECFLIEPETD